MPIHVALHVPCPAARGRVVGFLRAMPARVLCCDSPAALRAALATGPLPDAVVLALRDAGGCPATPLVRRLRADFPALPLVACGALSRGVMADVVAAAHAGLTAAALDGYDDLAAVLRRVTSAAAGADVAIVALAAIDRRLTPATRPVVGYCLAHAHTAPTVEQIAVAFGIRRQTVAARLAAARLPRASRVVRWGRLLLAARLLGGGGSVERAAHALGFDSGTALRHMLRRYTGLRTADVRDQGGLTAVLPHFVAAFGLPETLIEGAGPAALCGVVLVRALVAPPRGASPLEGVTDSAT